MALIAMRCPIVKVIGLLNGARPKPENNATIVRLRTVRATNLSSIRPTKGASPRLNVSFRPARFCDVKVVSVAVSFAYSEDETCCATSSTLPNHTVVATRRCRAFGTMMSSPSGERRNREESAHLRAPRGQERGWSGMVNICECLINVVIVNKPASIMRSATACFSRWMHRGWRHLPVAHVTSSIDKE